MSLSVESPPSKPSSPASPSSSLQIQQNSAPRSFTRNHNPNIRGQSSPFPQTPTSSVLTAFFEPPPGVSYLSFVRTWSDSQVARWLTEVKCAHHATTFKENDIRGDILLELDIPTLQEMGVASIGDRLRIANAVKILRQKTAPPKVAVFSPPATERLSRLNMKDLDYTDGRNLYGGLDSPHLQQTLHHQDTPDPSPTSRLASRSGRPAPLQLHTNTRSNDLPNIVRDHQQPPDSAKSSHSQRPTLITSTSSSSLSGGAMTPGPQSTTRTTHPQLPPIPRSQLPATARTPVRTLMNGGSQLSGRRTPTQPDAPPPFTAQPLPPAPTSSSQPSSSLQPPLSSRSNASYHLPADPRPGNIGGGKVTPSARAPSPYLPPRTSSRTGTAPPTTHSRSGSTGVSAPGPSNSKTSRPVMSHPYAQSNSAGLQPPNQSGVPNLSPIAESFHAQSSGTPSPPTTSYAVGRGPFNPAISPATNPTLDDLRKYIVKFTVPGEHASYKINIADCPGGVEILEKALRKVNKDGARNLSFERATLEGGGLSMGGWSIYMGLDENGNGEPLSESEILSICHAPKHSARELGLILHRSQKKRSDDYLQTPVSTKATRRASSISVLSGLGVADPEKALDPPSPTTSSTGQHAYATKKPSRLQNFFGQRPPSELITNHLTEYFPFTEKKVLERTARNSMMHRRDSTASWNQALASRFSSSSQGSIGRGRTSPRDSISSFGPPPPLPEKPFASNMEVPRVSLSTDDGRSIDLPLDDRSDDKLSSSSSAPQLLPPIPFPTESFAQTLETFTGKQNNRKSTYSTASSRMSIMTELRSKRDRSDTASLMTVDEITANVESRRESLAIDRMAIDSNTNTEIDEWTEVDSEDEDATLANEEELEVEVAVGPGDDDAASTLGPDAVEEEDEEEDEEEEDEEEEVSKAMTSDGHKWIKGALIGAGSFGQVYLGMDASTGLLMAVKQVELPSGSSANEDRKQSMLNALEREIELLKDLQHENIVQYLYSSADEDYLNIFLEYVPGGSVAALLRNYGAFEETLVKNFVRQILQGLQYLHERNIIHRDIKGGNILVDNKGGIKISDFGISKKTDTLMSGNRAHRPSLQGSVFWMAPEVVKQSGHSSKADIWSVGCLVVEMLTGEHPWAHLTQMQAIFKIGSSAKPTIPSDISAEAQDFLEKTFDLDADTRPSTGELLLHPWIAKKPSKGQAVKGL